MSEKKELGLHEAYQDDPIKSDLDIFGRESDLTTRRGFLKKSSLLAMSMMVGANIPFGSNMPTGLIPALFAESTEPFKIEGKDGLVYLNDRPVNAETPAHLLNDEFTPAKYLFIRSNGEIPKKTSTPDEWSLEISGESCKNPTVFTVADLKKKFKHYTYALQIECGGNGRKEFNPPAKGIQWSTGAIGCGRWTGVRLRDVLESCGIKKDAVYVGYYGRDIHLSGDPTKVTISRGVPMEKALEDETLLAWSYEGEDIPLANGYPLRLVAGGWPASVSGKWLGKIVVRNKVHDGEKMTGQSYRVPKNPVAPGEKVADEDMEIIASMPVKSLITFPRSGVTHKLKDVFHFNGKAWAGDLEVRNMEVSIDFGATWQKATKLQKPLNRLAWQHWEASVKFPKKGYYEVWAKATDSNNVQQPVIVPGWNPRGYLNNACHRIAVQVV